MGLNADGGASEAAVASHAKPALYIANWASRFRRQSAAGQGEGYAAKEGAPVVAISAKLEAEIATCPTKRRIFLATWDDEAGLNRVIHATTTSSAADLLHHGQGQVRAGPSAGAQRATGGGRDTHRFEKGFLRAESFPTRYVRLNGEARAKEAGKMRLEGKAYL